jgi:CRISPR-associated protein Cas2
MATIKNCADYAVVYDISSDRERARLDKLLKGFGFRVQESVFECRMRRRDRDELIRRVKELELKTGFVKIYRLEYSFNAKIIGTCEKRSPDEGNAFIV